MITHGIILCGGQATRMNGKIKGLLQICEHADTTILEHQINQLHKGGVDYIWLAARHGVWSYAKFLLDNHTKLTFPIDIIEEKVQLGTGGAIRDAIDKVYNVTHQAGQIHKFIVLNGDIIHNDKHIIEDLVQSKHEENIIVGWQVPAEQAINYGQICYDLESYKIFQFKEKQPSDVPVYINAGIYCFNTENYANFSNKTPMSIERDYFEKTSDALKMIPLKATFWDDIGTPERYEQLKTENWKKLI